MKMKLTIDRIEGEKAILKDDDGQTIIWPTEKLPEGGTEGTVLTFLITKGDSKNNELAKDIINEIINPQDNS